MSDLSLNDISSTIPRIFLSYRQSDTKAATARIYDWLERAFGKTNLFLDTYLDPGENWYSAIRPAIEGSDCVLVIIGSNWQAEFERRRREGAEDIHREEIEAALSLGKPVVPVLIDDAEMPPASTLPDTLKELSHTQAITIRNDSSFENQMRFLIRRIGRTSQNSGHKHSYSQTEVDLNWTGTFFSTLDLTGTGTPVGGISRLDFNVGTEFSTAFGESISEMGKSGFSARFLAVSSFLPRGNYEFVITVAGEARLFVNGALIANRISQGQISSNTFKHVLKSDQYRFRVEYIHRSDLAALQVLVRRLS